MSSSTGGARRVASAVDGLGAPSAGGSCITSSGGAAVGVSTSLAASPADGGGGGGMLQPSATPSRTAAQDAALICTLITCDCDGPPSSAASPSEPPRHAGAALPVSARALWLYALSSCARGCGWDEGACQHLHLALGDVATGKQRAAGSGGGRARGREGGQRTIFQTSETQLHQTTR